MKTSRKRLKKMHRYTCGAFLFVWACSLSAPGWAQPVSEEEPEQAVAGQAAAEPIWELEGITVTARRAEENPKDVPFTVNVVGSAEITERRLVSLEEALRQVPGVEINSYNAAFDTAVKIRGVGALQKASLDDTSVTFSMDGVPQSGVSATLNLLDVERVEVLKGPQGTLFGRNSEAGAINIVTRQPTQWSEGYFRTEFGEENQQMLEGAVSGPLADKLSGRFAARWSKSDHPVKNDAEGGRPVTKPEQTAMRGTLLWQPTEATDLTLTINYDKDTNKPAISVLHPYGDSPRVFNKPAGSSDGDKTAKGYTLKAEHSLSNSIFTSLTGYSETDYTEKHPFEGYLYERLYGIRPEAVRGISGNEDAFSQEFRWSSKPQAPVFWVVGMNYLHTDRIHDTDFDTGSAYGYYFASNPFNADIDRRFKVESKAIFGEVTYPVADRLKLTGGLRRSWEEKKYNAIWRANDDNPSSLRLATDRQELSDSYTTGRVALNYELNPRTNLYAVAARGYKTGGFNDVDTNIAFGLPAKPYGPTRVNSYEAGFKSTLVDNRLMLNGAYFYNDNDGDHLMVFDPVNYTASAENFDTRSKGAELELNWLVGGGFTLGAGVSYTDAKIVSVPTGSISGASAGNHVPDSAKWSTTLSLGYEKAVGDVLGIRDATLHGKITDRYVGSRAADPQNSFNLDAYHKVDVRVGLANAKREVYLWVDNLLDERFDYYGFNSGGYAIGVPSRGRTVGLGMATYF